MEQAANTKQALIEEWFLQWGDDLFRWAIHKTNERETANDLVQETFLAAQKALDKFEGRSEPKTWLFSILNNKIMDFYRKRLKEPTVSHDGVDKNGDQTSVLDHFFTKKGDWVTGNSPSNWHNLDNHLLDDHEFNKILEFCMRELPVKWMSAIQLKYLEDKAGKIICQELDITPSNFWQILHRAKLQLRACLELNWFNT